LMVVIVLVLPEPLSGEAPVSASADRSYVVHVMD